MTAALSLTMMSHGVPLGAHRFVVEENVVEILQSGRSICASSAWQTTGMSGFPSRFASLTSQAHMTEPAEDSDNT